jgi:hypothetical protein
MLIWALIAFGMALLLDELAGGGGVSALTAVKQETAGCLASPQVGGEATGLYPTQVRRIDSGNVGEPDCLAGDAPCRYNSVHHHRPAPSLPVRQHPGLVCIETPFSMSLPMHRPRVQANGSTRRLVSSAAHYGPQGGTANE